MLDGSPLPESGYFSDLPDVTEETLVIIAVWWRSSCHACLEQLDLLSTIHNPPYIIVVAVNVGDSEAKVRAAVGDKNFTVIIGIQQLPSGVTATPYTQTFIINPDTGQWELADQWMGGPKLGSNTQEILDIVEGYINE